MPPAFSPLLAGRVPVLGGAALAPAAAKPAPAAQPAKPAQPAAPPRPPTPASPPSPPASKPSPATPPSSPTMTTPAASPAAAIPLHMPRRFIAEEKARQAVEQLKKKYPDLKDNGDYSGKLHFTIGKSSAVEPNQDIVESKRMQFFDLSKAANGGNFDAPSNLKAICTTNATFENDDAKTKVEGAIVAAGISVRFDFSGFDAMTPLLIKQFLAETVVRFWIKGDKGKKKDLRLWEIPQSLQPYTTDGTRFGGPDPEEALWFAVDPLVVPPGASLAITFENVPAAVEAVLDGDVSVGGTDNAAICMIGVSLHGATQLLNA